MILVNEASLMWT